MFYFKFMRFKKVYLSFAISIFLLSSAAIAIENEVTDKKSDDVMREILNKRLEMTGGAGVISLSAIKSFNKYDVWNWAYHLDYQTAYLNTYDLDNIMNIWGRNTSIFDRVKNYKHTGDDIESNTDHVPLSSFSYIFNSYCLVDRKVKVIGNREITLSSGQKRMDVGEACKFYVWALSANEVTIEFDENGTIILKAE